MMNLFEQLNLPQPNPMQNPGMSLPVQMKPYLDDIQTKPMGLLDLIAQVTGTQGDINLTGDPKTYSAQIQEALGAKEPNQGGIAKDILSQRFQPQDITPQGFQQSPSWDDVAQGAAQTFFAGGNPVSGQNIADKRAIDQMSIIQKMQQNRQQALGGGTGILAQKLMEEAAANGNPMSFADALYSVQTGMRQGTQYDENGNIVVRPGYAGAKATIAGAQRDATNLSDQTYQPTTERLKQDQKNESDVNFAAAIKSEEKKGAGEITDIQKQGTAKVQVSDILNNMAENYALLKDQGAAVDTTQSGWENFVNRTRSSGAGQFLGKTFGTEEQSIRNQINQQIPALINQIRQSTGMSAKAMDSNVELKFYLQQATDPSLDIQTNMNALHTLEKLYGLSSGQSQQKIPQGGVVHFNDLPD